MFNKQTVISGDANYSTIFVKFFVKTSTSINFRAKIRCLKIYESIFKKCHKQMNLVNITYLEFKCIKCIKSCGVHCVCNVKQMLIRSLFPNIMDCMAFISEQ